MNSLQTAWELILVVMSGVVGFVSSWLLAGLGMFGLDLTAGVVCFALVSAAVLPAATVRVLSTRWWVSALIFSLCFPIAVFFQILGQEWNRVLAGLACIAVAFSSAWLFRLPPR